MTANLRDDLHRARVHLALLEQDATHPLEFLNRDYPTSPPFILRPGERLKTAHSDIGVGYEKMRAVLIAELVERVDELTRVLSDGDPHFKLEDLQYGDRTEA